MARFVVNKLKGVIGVVFMAIGVVLPIFVNVSVLGDTVFFSLVLIGAYLIRDAYF